MTAEEADGYYELTVPSSTKLEVFRRSPQEYHGRFVAGTIPDPDNQAMINGRALHAAVLEWDVFTARYCRRPRPAEQPDFSELGKPQSKAYRAALKAWRETEMRRVESLVGGRTMLDDVDMDRVVGMSVALEEHELARKMLAAPGRNEVSAFYRHRPSGLVVRIRWDKLLGEDGPADAIVDLKSTSSVGPEAFAMSSARFGYHRQAALYIDAHEALWGTRPPFYSITVHNVAPFEVAVYEYDSDTISAGRRQASHSLIDLAERIRTNNWLADWSASMHELRLPAWSLE